MWGSKCPNCAKKIKKDFRFCPYCGLSFRGFREQEEFGLLGRDDFADLPIKMPMGSLDKIIAPLVKQLVDQFDKEMGNIQKNPGISGPGFKIQISTGQPIRNIKMQESQQVNDSEVNRRRGLPRKEPESNVRRLSDKVVYEISVPGVKSRQDISISKLENSIEVKAYSKEVCYIKTIPLKVDVLNYKIKDGTLFLELKS
jgi:HSP20 family molecular chaperone IbpA